VAEEWHCLAWQGVEAEVPADWELSRANRDAKEGQLAAHDEDGVPRFALQWKVPKKEVDLERTFEDYEKRVRKRLKGTLSVQDDAHLVSKRKLGKKQLRTFIIEGSEEISYGALWYCKECGKAVLAQVFAKPGENLRPVAERVLGSIKDHPDDEWLHFATYGLDFYVPGEFELAEAKLLSAQVTFRFEHKEEKLTLVRWGLAKMMLARGDLPSLVYTTFLKKRKDFTTPLDPIELELHGHTALMWVGQPAGFLARSRDKVLNKLKLKHSKVYVVLAWECPQTNRIFAIEGVLEQERRGLVRATADTVLCHQEET